MSGVGLFGRDQIVCDLFVLLHIENDNARTETDAVMRNLREIDHRNLGQTLLELIQAGVDHALTLFSRMILGVFA